MIALFALLACNPPLEEDTGDPSLDTVYAEPWRPQVHLTPPENWMNDPNGLYVRDGQWHVFYQHQPDLPIFGRMSWGHAVSSDWTAFSHLPVALSPDPALGSAFSGSAVVDAADSSGLCGGQSCPVLVFTHHGGDDGAEKQSLAASTDGGSTWTPYAGNPVLQSPGPADFRDPKVFWHTSTGRWVMVLAAGDRALLYGSSDLKAWTALSEVGPLVGDEGVWEMPDLFELPVEGEAGESRWVLLLGTNPGFEHGGSGSRYLLGAFDGTTFVPDGGGPRWLDHGMDLYAVQTFSEAPGGRRVGLGWMSNWRYALWVPTDPWRGALGLPRELSLVRRGGEIALVQAPIAELEGLRARTLVDLAGASEQEATEALAGVHGRALEIEAVLDVTGVDAVTLSVRVGQGEATEIRWVRAGGTLAVDRTASGAVDFHAGFPGVHGATVALQDERLDLRVFVDWSSVEVFALDGTVALTDLVFPAHESTGVSLATSGGSVGVERLRVYALRSVWAPPR